MTASIYLPMNVAPLPGLHPVAMSRPQVGIERLPTRRLSNEPREAMNCKSCRKRKIKCNRLRPSCEACQVFQCPCIYDAVPKKRGPKTDILDALLKRVDGLEQRLKDQKQPETSPTDPGSDGAEELLSVTVPSVAGSSKPKLPIVTTALQVEASEPATYSESPQSEPSPEVPTEALFDTYFTRFHAKPYHILDESSVRQRSQLGQLPAYLLHAIYAVASRYTPHPRGYQSAVRQSEEFAMQARSEMDVEEPSVDGLQTLLLLVIAFTAAGRGKKAFMLMTNAIGMAIALELHREADLHVQVTPVERETRRRLFWTCYLLDRFMACGSKRPSLISDKGILLRLPSWSLHPSSLPIEGEFFQRGSNLQYLQGSGKTSQGSSGMLIDISRVLGTTNRYLAAGGVKGDSHFPWHSLSNLSKIRQDLDIWASGTADVFSSVEALFGQPDSTVLVLSKLIYHLIHCLIYRPFLPIDLAELAGTTGQHQSWQIDATNMCFLHANAIAELVEFGKQTGTVEWPAFVGYCICTAGTVHIHGAHYNNSSSSNGMGDNSGNGNNNGSNASAVFAASADFLSREMQQLAELRYAWSTVQHQRETLQHIYAAHAQLVKSLGAASGGGSAAAAVNSMRYAPAFQLEDFFDRYANVGGVAGVPAFNFDAANLGLADVVVDLATDTYTGHDLYAPRTVAAPGSHNLAADQTSPVGVPDRPNLKRKNTAPSGRKRPDLLGALANTPQQQQQLVGIVGAMAPPTPGMPTPGFLDSQQQHHQHHRHTSFSTAGSSTAGSSTVAEQPTPSPLLGSQVLHPHHHHQQQHPPQPHQHHPHHHPDVAAMQYFSSSAGQQPFSSPPQQQQPLHQQPPQQSAFSYGTPPPPHAGSAAPGSAAAYDPMFGGLPTTTFSSPAAWQGGGGGHGPDASAGAAQGAVQGHAAAAAAGGGGGGVVGADEQAPVGGTGRTPDAAPENGQSDETDPFLSLLEQLAENGLAGGQGNELDFFFGLPGTA